MPLEADAAKWWDDPDLHEVRQRIERRRAREASIQRQASTGSTGASQAPGKRGVRELRGVSRLALLPAESDADRGPEHRRARPRPRAAERLGPRPDIIAAWAVVLGIVLLLVAILTAHS